MTGANFLNRLSERIEDPSTTGSDGNNYTRQQLIDISNISQETLINLIDYSYLSSLEEIDPGITVLNGVCAFSASPGIKSNKRILKYKVDGGKWCQEIPLSAVNNLDNSYTAGTSEYPFVWFFDETAHFSPTTITSVDIYYIKDPSVVTDSSTVIAFQDELIDPLLSLAEAEFWKQDNNAGRSELAMKRASDQINILNQRVK